MCIDAADLTADAAGIADAGVPEVAGGAVDNAGTGADVTNDVVESFNAGASKMADAGTDETVILTGS